MMKHKKIIVALLSLMGLTGTAEAQNGFNLPYSQFGIGIGQLPYNLPMVARMGGVAYTRSGSNYINPFNPASYASIGMESFVFDMGANVQITTLANNNSSIHDADGNIGYLLFGMPLTRWWKLAAGLIPYSSVDYSSIQLQEGDGYNTMKNVYDGTGGVNEVFLGTAFNVLGGPEGRRLQAGFNVGYLVGRIQRAISYSFQGIDSTHYINSRRYKETKLSNLLFDLGIQYWEPLGERYTLGAGLTYKPRRAMDLKEQALIYTYHAADNNQSPVDTIFPLPGNSPFFTSTLSQDHTFGIGLSLERNHKWLVAADATFAGWAGMFYEEGSNASIFGEDALRKGPYSRYALGFEKIGNMDASSYWGRISWSVGTHMERGSMRLFLDGSERVINEWGCGMGASLPMRKGLSLLTLNLGYSSLGNKDLLQYNCFTVGIAVSSCERWFVKRKYN